MPLDEENTNTCDVLNTISILQRLREEVLTAKLQDGGMVRDVTDVRIWFDEQLEALWLSSGIAL